MFERETLIPPSLKDDMLNGVEEIAEFLGQSRRQTYHQIARGLLPGVFKIGTLYKARRTTLLEEIRRLEKGAA